MRAIVQRVLKSEILVDNKIISNIDNGILILLGIEKRDTLEDVTWLADKIGAMRIFSGKQQKMDKSVIDIDGEVLVVSQFTLHASTKKGNRPSYLKSAAFEQALILYESFLEHISSVINKPVKSGKFGANMQVSLINDGPVTIIIDSQNKE